MYLSVHVLHLSEIKYPGTVPIWPSQAKCYLSLQVLQRSLSLYFHAYAYRYVKAFPFTNKNEQKEMIETKLVKEEKADDGNSGEDSKNTDKKPEEPNSPPKTTVRCMEAEVQKRKK